MRRTRFGLSHTTPPSIVKHDEYDQVSAPKLCQTDQFLGLRLGQYRLGTLAGRFGSSGLVSKKPDGRRRTWIVGVNMPDFIN
jgi:hypothetical protein